MDVVGVFIPGLPGPMRVGGGNPTSQEFDLVHGGVWGHGYQTWGRRRGGPTLCESDLRYKDIVGGGGGEETRCGKREERNVLKALGLGKLGS